MVHFLDGNEKDFNVFLEEGEGEKVGVGLRGGGKVGVGFRGGFEFVVGVSKGRRFHRCYNLNKIMIQIIRISMGIKVEPFC